MTAPQTATTTLWPPDHRGLIGARLKEFRQARGLTLKDLAVLAGTSIGHLSQLERDRASPSVKTLYTISRALGIAIGRFFDDGEGDGKETQHVVRKSKRRHIKFAAGIDDYRLTGDAVSQLTLLYCTLAPGAAVKVPYTHPGEEAGFVASGWLELVLEDTKITLEVGDAFSFSSEVPHRYRNPGKTETVVIWATSIGSYPHNHDAKASLKRHSRGGKS